MVVQEFASELFRERAAGVKRTEVREVAGIQSEPVRNGPLGTQVCFTK